MTDPANRRGFLRGLVSLPLIGGSAPLVGAPSAVAVSTSLPLLKRYAAWLAQEHGRVHDEFLRLAPADQHHWGRPDPAFAPMRPIGDLVTSHWPQDQVAIAHAQTGLAGARAALVLSTVGCDWQEGASCA